MASRLLLLLAVSTASALDLRNRRLGGSVTVVPRWRNPDGSFQLEVRSLQTTYRCHADTYTCLYGDCGSEVASNVSEVVRDSNWCVSEAKTTVRLPLNHPVAFSYPKLHDSQSGSGYWIPNVRGAAAAWEMMAHVDLGIRSDTHRSNSPPVSAMLPILRVTKNCPRSISLMVFDPDGDRVTCRVPTSASSNECGVCGATAGFTVDQDSCSLTYEFSGRTGNHPVEIVVEDFPHQRITLYYSQGYYTTKRPAPAAGPKRFAQHTSGPTTTRPPPPTVTADWTSGSSDWSRPPASYYLTSIPPLSKIPLQFTVHVDSFDAPSCLHGDYFPIFSAPTPVNGASLPASASHPVEFEVRSTARFTRVGDLMVIGPAGISKQLVTPGLYVIRWKPTAQDLSGRYPVCFVSEARDGSSRVYQSEPRCLTVQVSHYEAVVTCTETAMKVEVRKNDVIERHQDKLHLKDFTDASCSLKKHSNSTHLVAVMRLNACGTQSQEDEANIIFRNQISSADPREIITRKQEVQIAISCVYPKKTNLTLGFRHKNPYAFSERGFGSFTFQFEFFQSQLFRQQVEGSTYPVEVSLKQMIYMQIQATSSIPNTELFVESCRATPYDNPNSPISYSIIENGCVRDQTVQIYPSSKSVFRFGMEAFEFIGAHDEVYITCSVILCESGVPGTRCSRGCIKSGSGRYRREASGQSGNHFISQGPLRLRRTSDTEERDRVLNPVLNLDLNPAPNLSLNLVLNLVLAVGCLVVCVVVIYRSRSGFSRSRTQYQRLPTFELD